MKINQLIRGDEMMAKKPVKGIFFENGRASVTLLLVMLSFLLSVQAFAQVENIAPEFMAKGIYKTGLPNTNNTAREALLARNTHRLEALVNIRLDGVTEYELAEVFGKVIGVSSGVLNARRITSKIVPDNPRVSFAHWKVLIEGTNCRRLQSDIMNVVRQIINAGGQFGSKGGQVYRFTGPEVDLLKKIRPGNTTAGDIQFLVDR